MATPSAPGRPNLVVRNTFIDAVDPEDEDAVPNRTVSDQTSSRTQQVVQIGRLESTVKSGPLTIAEDRVCGEVEDFHSVEDTDETANRDALLSEDTVATEGAENSLAQEGGGEDNGDEDDDDEDDEDDDDDELERLLTRTQSVAMGPPVGYEAADWYNGPCVAAMPPPENWPYYMQMPYVYDHNLGVFLGGPNHPNGFPCPVNAGFICDPLQGQGGDDDYEPASASNWNPPESAEMPPLGACPPFGTLHRFHAETKDMGTIAPDFRQFCKTNFEGRLSVVTEKHVHHDGTHRYLVQFTSGELSRADGVGFVFSGRLPCAKNIQRIVSIFINQRGRICMRVFSDILRASAYVQPLELGDWVEMAINLDDRVATFYIWPSTTTDFVHSTPSSSAIFDYGQRLSKLDLQTTQKTIKLNVGHLACVVKNTGVTVTIGS